MPTYNGCKIVRSKAKGKKYAAICGDRTINFGAKGYTIKPGTPAGDSYCARSAGIKSEGKSPNAFARALWSCRGKKSISDKPFFGKIQLP